MSTQLRPAIVSFAALTLITGVIYPAVVTGIAKLAFADKASGSVIERDGRAIGSNLIAQSFTDPKYFWPRPSAANYDGAAGAGSNLGPNNPALAEAVTTRIKTFGDNGMASGVPADLVTASGSGLDPHISPASAEAQVARVAKARSMSPDAVRKAIADSTEARTFGLLGEPCVNVLRLNLLLDGSPAQTHVAVTQGVTGWRARAFLPKPN